jgi:hypothetical protein
MKQGPIPRVNIAHNTVPRGYRGAELDDDSTPVSRPLNIAHNTLPQDFARMGLLPLQGVVGRITGMDIAGQDQAAGGGGGGHQLDLGQIGAMVLA